MRLTIFLFVTGAACLNVAAQIQVFENSPWPNIAVAAQDAEGSINAAGKDDQWLFWRWNEDWQPPQSDNSPWLGWNSSGISSGSSVSMESAANGQVLSLWDNKNNGSIFCILHKNGRGWNDGFIIFDGLQGPAARARLLMDSQTNVWVTEAGLNICKAQGLNPLYKQKAVLVHTIVTSELWPDGDFTNRLPVSITEDGRGRLWFWSSCLLGDDRRGAIHGVLIHEDGAVTNISTLDGVKAGRISVIVPLDKTNLWLAVRDAGIYSVDLETLRGSPVTEPEPGAFYSVQQIFKDGDDEYVIAGRENELTPLGRFNSLWRRRGGAWKQLITGLDSNGGNEQFADRHWRFTTDGLWLGAFGTGGWFVPRDDGEPRQISWQAGCPLDTIHRWLQLKDGRLLAIQFSRGGMIADSALLTPQPANASAEVLQLNRPIIQTRDGKIFAIRREKESALSEWDGQHWIRHPFPDKVQLWSECRITTDARNRIWFIDQSYNPDPVLRPTLVFDPADGKFLRLSNFRSALQSQAAKLASTKLGDDKSCAAVFAGDGRIAYTDNNYQIHYFDGHEWRAWHYSQIVRNGYWSGNEHPPFFGDDGRLAADFNGKTWRFDGLGGWKNTDTVAMKKNTLPAGTPNIPEADSVVTDRRGIHWIVARRQLYRSGFGLRATVFPANEPQPFVDGRKLAAAFVDNAGNAFLQTGLKGREEMVFIPVRDALPETKIQTHAKSDEITTLELSAPNASHPRFSWRVDDGDWSEATTNTTLQLDELEVGKHRVQIITFDEHLQTGVAPAEVSVEVKHNPEQSLQQWIGQLGDKDFARREAAVKHLSRHAAVALPALQQARDQETDRDRRWWLDAAIQQCK